MNGNRVAPCLGCGASLEPDAAACASCGRLVARSARPAGQMSGPIQVVLGLVGGLVVGLPLTVPVLFGSLKFDDFANSLHLSFLSTPLAEYGLFLFLLGAMLALGIGFAVRGWIFVGTLVIVAGIVSVVPAAACDALLNGALKGDAVRTPDGRNSRVPGVAGLGRA